MKCVLKEKEGFVDWNNVKTSFKLSLLEEARVT